MKKIVILFMILFLLPAISAASINMNSEFKQGETLMAEISGNFVEPLTAQNVLLYQGHIRIPLNVDLTKIGNTYYVYAQLYGKEEGNYSLNLENVRYTRINQVIEEDVISNFSITNETSDFSVNPAFIVTEEGFSIELQNLKGNEIIVKVNENKTEESTESPGFFEVLFGIDKEEALTEEKQVIISPWNSETIKLNITNITKTELREITLYTDNQEYKIPVYVIVTKEIATGTPEKSYVFSPINLDFVMSTNSTTTRIIYLYNDGGAIIEDIEFLISDSLIPYVDLSEEFISELEPNESVKITLSFYSDDEEKIIEGDIRANSSDLYAYLGVLVDFVPDYIPLETNDNQSVLDPSKNPSILETCEDLEGIICADNQQCSEDTVRAKNGNCCPQEAECNIVIMGNPKSKIIGWTIIGGLILAALWFYRTKVKN